MSNLENNELLETMDGSVSLGDSGIKSIMLRKLEDIIVYLETMNSLSKNSLAYLNKIYKEDFEIDDKRIVEIEKLELDIFLLEKEVFNAISGEDTCKAKYDEYLTLHRNFMSNFLFDNDSHLIVKTVLAMNTVLEQIPEVSDLVQKRKNTLDKIAELDKFKEDVNTVYRFRRVFLQRRLCFYTIMLSELTTLKRYEDTISNNEALAQLLTDQDDFAFHRFNALLKPVVSEPELELNDPQPTNDPSRRKTLGDKVNDTEQRLTGLKTELGDTTQRFRSFSIGNKSNQDARELLQSIMKLQRIVASEEANLRSLKELLDLSKPKDEKEKEKERKKKIEEKIKEHFAHEVGAVVGNFIYLTFKADKPEDWKEFFKESMEKIIVDGGALVAELLPKISGPIAGGFVKGFCGPLIAGMFKLEKEDPILEKVKEIKKVVDEINTKIDELGKQITAFQSKMETMIGNLPKAIILEIENNQLQSRVNNSLTAVRTKLSNSRISSELIIENKRNGTYETNQTENLINHSSDVLKLAQDLITNIYGNASFQIDYFKPNDEPSATSLFGFYWQLSKKEHTPFGFRTQFSELKQMLLELKLEVFEPYYFIQKDVNKALEIRYSMGNDAKFGGEIIKFLYNQKRIELKQQLLCDDLHGKLSDKMLGFENYYLFQNMFLTKANLEPVQTIDLEKGNQGETSKTNLFKFNANQFDFTKSFGLQMQEVTVKDGKNVESWHFCTYNYKTQQFEKIKIDEKSAKVGHISRFFILPGSTEPIYNLYCSNDDCVQELIKAKVNLDLDDSISITLITSDNVNRSLPQTFKVVPITDPVFDNSVDRLFAINGHIVLPVQSETIVQMPLNNVKLKINSQQKLKPDETDPSKFVVDSYEYRIVFVKHIAATKDKEERHEFGEIFLENLDPLKFKGGVILKFDYAKLCCSLGTLDADGKVDKDVSIEIFSFKPKERQIVNQMYATNWKLQSKTGYPLSIDNRYLVSYLNKQFDMLPAINSKLIAGQSLYKNEEILTDRYRIKYTGDGNFSFYAYNNIGNTYEEYLLKSEKFADEVEVLTMQGDGCLVAYDKNGKNVWQKGGNAESVDYVEMYTNAKLTAYNYSGQAVNIFEGVDQDWPKLELKPAEYLKRGEAIQYKMEVGPTYERQVIETRLELTKEGDLQIIHHPIGHEIDALRGTNAHYLKMNVDGTLALYDDKKNILKQIKAEKEKVKFSLFGVNGQAIGAFFENNDTSSMPISNFWFNKWQ